MNNICLEKLICVDLLAVDSCRQWVIAVVNTLHKLLFSFPGVSFCWSGNFCSSFLREQGLCNPVVMYSSVLLRWIVNPLAMLIELASSSSFKKNLYSYKSMKLKSQLQESLWPYLGKASSQPLSDTLDSKQGAMLHVF